MRQMLYVSGASRPMTDADIENILAVSRQNNARDDITGMLLWADGVFIQVLEGQGDRIGALAAKIRQDRRHRNFMVVLEQDARQRVFSDWSMGFRKLHPGNAEDEGLFEISRAALANRMSDHDGGLFLDTVLAFSRDFLADSDSPKGAVGT